MCGVMANTISFSRRCLSSWANKYFRIGTFIKPGQPLKDWKRPPGLVPQAWRLEEEGHLALATLDEGGRAEIVDIRPFVEVEYQLRRLHGA